MTGVDIVGTLLRAFDPVTDIVPSPQIKAGRLPDTIVLPALLLRTVSLTDRLPLKRTGMVRVTARIAVTVRAASYREQCAIIALVRQCCAGRVGNIGGGTRVAILPAGLGPDVNGPGNTFEQTQDFKVSFDAAV